ncbi:MAG TPA: hypothetical protein VGT05_03510 [Patescibacteria group bacterium]|nr:hypothetical protein [Patescibacteria group bacterium]
MTDMLFAVSFRAGNPFIALGKVYRKHSLFVNEKNINDGATRNTARYYKKVSHIGPHLS